jgi:hypothetical protein
LGWFSRLKASGHPQVALQQLEAWIGGAFSMIGNYASSNLGEKMIFYTRYGYLVVVFFVVAAFMAGGLGTAYNLDREVTSVLLFLFWGPLCVVFERNLDTSEKHSRFFWIPMEYLGYGLILLGVLGAFINWDRIARDWFSVAS